MAKVYKIQGYFVDINDEFDLDSFNGILDRYDMGMKHVKVEEADIGEWYDDHPLNCFNCSVSKYEKYFNGEV